MGDDAGAYVIDHESEFISELRELVLSKKTKESDVKAAFGILAQMESQESLSLILISLTNERKSVRKLAAEYLRWRAETLDEENAKFYWQHLKNASSDR